METGCTCLLMLMTFKFLVGTKLTPHLWTCSDTSQEAPYVERWVTYKLLLVATTCKNLPNSPHFLLHANLHVNVVLLYYEYLITLADEIRLVWQRRWTFAAVLVILIRYGFLVDVTLMTLYRVGRSVTLTAERYDQAHRSSRHAGELTHNLTAAEQYTQLRRVCS